MANDKLTKLVLAALLIVWLLLIIGMALLQDAGDGACSGLHVGGGDCVEMLGE